MVAKIHLKDIQRKVSQEQIQEEDKVCSQNGLSSQSILTSSELVLLIFQVYYLLQTCNDDEVQPGSLWSDLNRDQLGVSLASQSRGGEWRLRSAQRHRGQCRVSAEDQETVFH